MQLRAEQLEAHLAKSLAAVYTVHGDEPLLALEAADAVRSAARRAGYGEREVFFAERGFDWSELRHASASMSLFGGKKLLELRIPGGKPGPQGGDAIAALCADPNPDTLLLVSVPRLDRTTQGSAWFSALAAAGAVIDVFPVERARLPAWIGERLARQGQSAGRDVLEFLADRVEGNLLAAFQEVQKLALLAPQGELDLGLVQDVVTNVARYDAYGASAALLSGDMARYVRVLEGLRGEGEAPTLVLWAIAEDLRALAHIQKGVGAGRPLEGLLREARVWGPRQALMRSALRRYAPAALARSLGHAALVDRAIKGVARLNPWDEFIKLGLKLAHGSKA